MSGEDAHLRVTDEARLAEYAAAEVTLTAPGAPFETESAEVLGEAMAVFVHRYPSIGALFADSAKHGDRLALVFGDGRRITFTELHQQVEAVAAHLRDEHAIGPGDRVAIAAANGAGWILGFWACTALGAITVAMNGWWTEHEMAQAIALTEPKLALVDTKRATRLGPDPAVAWIDIEADIDRLIAHRSTTPLAPVATAEDDPAVLMFTSGTTGRPKAAVLTHRVLLAFVTAQFFIGARQLLIATGGAPAPAASPGATRTPPTRLVLFPLFHISGLSGILGAAATGSTTVWPLGRFDPGAVIQLTIDEGINTWGGTGTHIVRLLDHPDVGRIDPAQLAMVGMGGSATTPDIIRRCDETFPHLAGSMSSGYGATELGGVVTYAPNWMLAAAPNCVGPPLPTVELRITDDLGSVLPDGEEGDIWVRGPSVMPGYWHDDQADALAFAEGHWYRTGDYGRLDGGLLYLAARRRDLILRGGENIYPFEIENRLEEHPEVREVAVVGIDHSVLGQEVRAVVVVDAGSTVTGAALQAFCAETLASFKVPAHVDLRTEPLPRNASGKVMKQSLDSGDTTLIAE